MEYVKLFLEELWAITLAMSPYLLLGFLFAGILKVWFPQRWIDRFMGKSNFMSVVNATLIGIPLPLCSCGVIPTGISLYRNGASKGSVVSFFISTPQTGVDSILVTYSMLGLPFAMLRVLVALITGVVGGWLTNIFDKSANENVNKQVTHESIKENRSTLKSLWLVFRYGFYEFMMDIAKWLIIGLLIAALLAAVLPDNFFSLYLDNELLSMLIVLLAAVPLYLCATASVPVALVLMLKGMSPGAALVLLMAGPATNAATITMIKKVFGSKTLLTYLSSIILGALFFGYLINTFLPREWFAIADHAMHVNHEHEMIPEWLTLLSAILLIGLIINGYVQGWLNGYRQKQVKKNLTSHSVLFKPSGNAPVFQAPVFSHPSASNLIIKVEGMTCSHCKASVESNLLKVSGIKSVVANPQANTVQIVGQPNLDDVKRVIDQLGYRYIEKLN